MTTETRRVKQDMAHTNQTPKTPIRVFLTEYKIRIETTDPEIYDRLNDILSMFPGYSPGEPEDNEIAVAYISDENEEHFIEIALVREK